MINQVSFNNPNSQSVSIVEPSLPLLENARQAIEKARTIDEVKDIRDKAQAIAAYLKQAEASLEMQNAAAEIKLRAERRGGELLREMQKNEGGRPNQNLSHDGTGFKVSPPKLPDLGLTRNQSSRWQQIATLPEEKFEQHIEETKSSGKELTSSGVLDVVKKEKRE